MDTKIRWCGCKSTCAEEDRGRAKPNPDGRCELYAEDGPSVLADRISCCLTPEQRETIAGSGVTDEVMEIVETKTRNWASEEVDRTLSMIEKLCGYVRRQQ